MHFFAPVCAGRWTQKHCVPVAILVTTRSWGSQQRHDFREHTEGSENQGIIGNALCEENMSMKVHKIAKIRVPLKRDNFLK